MSDFVGAVVALATAPFPLLILTICVVAVVVAALNERKAR